MTLHLGLLVVAISSTWELAPILDDPAPRVLRLGIIGLDTSHVIAFTDAINSPSAKSPLDTIEVVAGFPGGSPDIPASRDRIESFTQQLRDRGLTIVDTLAELVEQVDGILLESVDGRKHLEQAVAVFESGKPVFIDKPLAASLTEAILIAELARHFEVKWFSSSSLRFAPGLSEIRDGQSEFGDVVQCSTFSPCSLEPTHPDLFWYGIHGIELLVTLMGPGCQSVSRTATAGNDLVVGIWSDGRIGTFRGLREGKRGYGAQVFGTKKIGPAPPYRGYASLVQEIGLFFREGKIPVSPDETLEVFAIMEAAQRSHDKGGVPIRLEDVWADAKSEADRRVATYIR